jgi:hypothetical protein
MSDETQEKKRETDQEERDRKDCEIAEENQARQRRLGVVSNEPSEEQSQPEEQSDDQSDDDKSDEKPNETSDEKSQREEARRARQARQSKT